MGFFGILRMNFRSIKTQRELEDAIAKNDEEKMRLLIAESISGILKAGLTSRQLRDLENIKDTHGEQMQEILVGAFQHGWTRSGVPNLSNAMDEVLREAQALIKAHTISS